MEEGGGLVDYLRVAVPLGPDPVSLLPLGPEQAGLGSGSAAYLKVHPSHPRLPASHRGKGRVRGPSSASQFCLCRLYQDEAPDSVSCPPLAPGRFGRGKVGMGQGGVDEPVLWGMSRLPTSLWGSTAGLHYGRGKPLPSHPGQHRSQEDRSAQPFRLLATACWLYSGSQCVGVRHTGNLRSGLDPYSVGFPRGLCSRGLSTSASPIPLLTTGRCMLILGREPRQAGWR